MRKIKLALLVALIHGSAFAQTDLFVMLGSDINRPGASTRANYNIGIGHTFERTKEIVTGEEMTISYTYENTGPRGFFYSGQGAHSVQLGEMKNINLSKQITGYTWGQSGLTTYTGDKVQNRMSTSTSVGVIWHLSDNHGVWFQESYSKVVTVPWYTTASMGYAFSW